MRWTDVEVTSIPWTLPTVRGVLADWALTLIDLHHPQSSVEPRGPRRIVVLDLEIEVAGASEAEDVEGVEEKRLAKTTRPPQPYPSATLRSTTAQARQSSLAHPLPATKRPGRTPDRRSERSTNSRNGRRCRHHSRKLGPEGRVPPCCASPARRDATGFQEARPERATLREGFFSGVRVADGSSPHYLMRTSSYVKGESVAGGTKSMSASRHAEHSGMSGRLEHLSRISRNVSVWREHLVRHLNTSRRRGSTVPCGQI